MKLMLAKEEKRYKQNNQIIIYFSPSQDSTHVTFLLLL